MRALWKKLATDVTGPFLVALLLGGGFLIFTAWDQSHWWRVKDDYSFGWIVPAFVAFIIHDRWSRITAAAAACGAPGSRRATGWRAWLLNMAAGTALAFGALMFLLGAFYRAGAGTSQPGTLAITLGMVAMLLPLLWFNTPVSTAPDCGGLREDARLRLTGLFLFPVLVWLVSAPMVSAVETQISLFLLRKVVTVVAFVFDMLGLPLEQQGNVLMLPKGPVGVADACSGIRSLTACLFAGSFLGAVFFEELWKKVVLVAASMVFAFVMNLGRSLFLTGWAYAYGPDAISGNMHDIAGYAVLGLTCAGLLLLVPLLNLKFGD